MWLFSKIWRIDLIKICHVSPILFAFMSISEDHKCYLVDIKWCIMYLMLYSVLKLHIKGTLSYSNNEKKTKWSTKPLNHSSIVSDLYLIPELATITFILFSGICLLCCCIDLEISLWWRWRGMVWSFYINREHGNIVGIKWSIVVIPLLKLCWYL